MPNKESNDNEKVNETSSSWMKVFAWHALSRYVYTKPQFVCYFYLSNCIEFWIWLGLWQDQSKASPPVRWKIERLWRIYTYPLPERSADSLKSPLTVFVCGRKLRIQSFSVWCSGFRGAWASNRPKPGAITSPAKTYKCIKHRKFSSTSRLSPSFSCNERFTWKSK